MHDEVKSVIEGADGAVSSSPPLDTLIILSGHAGAGKDTVAAMLRMHGYWRFAIGDLVKAEIDDAVQNGGLDSVHALSLHPTPFLHPEVSAFAKPMSPEMRRLAQWWGTDFRRRQDPDYWARRMEETFRQWRLGGRSFGFASHFIHDAVITDARFQNEFDLCHSAAVSRHWRVDNNRLDLTLPMYRHASEDVASHPKPDHVIINNGSIYDLAESVIAAMATI